MKSRLTKANIKLTLLVGAGVVTHLVICFAIIALKWLQSFFLGSWVLGLQVHAPIPIPSMEI